MNVYNSPNFYELYFVFVVILVFSVPWYQLSGPTARQEYRQRTKYVYNFNYIILQYKQCIIISLLIAIARLRVQARVHWILPVELELAACGLGFAVAVKPLSLPRPSVRNVVRALRLLGLDRHKVDWRLTRRLARRPKHHLPHCLTLIERV